MLLFILYLLLSMGDDWDREDKSITGEDMPLFKPVKPILVEAFRLTKTTQYAKQGDWVIFIPGQETTYLTDSEFHEQYQPVEEDTNGAI